MPPVTLNLIIANVAVFLLESAGTLSPEGMLALWPPVSGPFGSNFELWQLITYSFLHGNTAHIFFNMFALYMFGSDVERLFGARFYAAYYFVSVFAAAICHLVVTTWMGADPVPTVGASGGIYGVLLAYGLYFPHRQVMLLIPPIPMSARTLVVVYAVLELVLGVTGTAAAPGERPPARDHSRVERTLRGLRRAADRRSGARRGRARAHGAPGIQGRDDPRPRERPVARRQALLADLRARAGARRSRVHASGDSASRGRGGLLQGLPETISRAPHRGLGLRRRDRDAGDPHGAVGHVRSLSAAEDHPRAPGRGAAVLTLAHRHGPRAPEQPRLVLPRHFPRPLLDHYQRQFLDRGAAVLGARDGRGPDPVLGGLPFRAQPAGRQVDAGHPVRPGGPRENLRRQRAAPAPDVASGIDFATPTFAGQSAKGSTHAQTPPCRHRRPRP